MTREIGLRLAIAHDALVCRGGAERVVGLLLSRWPNVPVFTSAYLPEATFECFRRARVVPSALQAVAFSPHFVMRRVFPLMVPAFRRFDFSGYDVVLSSTAYAAKAIRVPRHISHKCYCYTPLRLAWRPDDYLSASTAAAARAAVRALAAVLRKWDYRVAQRVHAYATTCQNVKRRIAECYGRDAVVIPAPVDLARYRMKPTTGGYFLLVSRLNQYKRVDLAVEAFNRLRLPLLVVGDGPKADALASLARSQRIRFLGAVSDEELLELYAGCEALVFPQEEDYGLTPLEAQASGRPVIALAAGGALETVVDGETGVLFGEQSVDGLVAAVERCRDSSFDPGHIRAHAARFDVGVFCDRIAAFVRDSPDGGPAGGG